ncbi:hypothetical protein [Photorhabdus africana]|uniref:hypothetical protein n=1 Tax=Photorhabdus africana TaxID=3097554 RepID=UPI002B400CAA|nr:hypothetical protein [Photorhabdus sp. CRI-LC]
MMTIWTLKQIVALAQANSPLYRELYADLSPESATLLDLPVLSHERLMEIVHNKDAIRFFNTDTSAGIIYQSSATTGKPKATLFGRDEWLTTMKMLANYYWKFGFIKDGDIIANLCVGNSASFMFVHGTIEQFPGRCSELPLGSDQPFDYLISTWQKFSANVLTGINSIFLGLAHHLQSQGITAPEVKRILCTGELFYGKQAELIQAAFPEAVIIPFIYATTETGLIGLQKHGFSQNEFYVCPQTCILEIVDPVTKEVIEEPGQIGLAVVTSLLRTAAPAIRVEVGDYAEWIDPLGHEDRKFSIHGRRYLKQYPFGNTFITETDIYKLIKNIENELPLLKLCLEIYDDKATIVVSCMNHDKNHIDPSTVIHESVNRLFPHAKLPQHYLGIELVPFSRFMDGIRRKGRFITDLRTQ